jgi:hypothetical protein
MGHDLPEQVWRPVVGALAENFGAKPLATEAP